MITAVIRIAQMNQEPCIHQQLEKKIAVYLVCRYAEREK